MSRESRNNKPFPWYWSIITGGFAGSVAEVLTMPLDTAKVRLQIQGGKRPELGSAFIPKYKGMVHAIKTILTEEGTNAFYKGLVAGIHRQIIFTGIRIGLYSTVRDLIVKKNESPTLIKRIMAGMISGAIAIIIACPTDVVKIRLQAEGKKPAGQPRKYQGSMDAYGKILKEEGVRGLYKGLFPNIIRNSLMNAAELGTYDHVKSTVLKAFPNVLPESKILHVVCGLTAGLFGVVAASPVDLIKTRIMSNPEKYGNAVTCFLKTLKHEGPLAFYGGFNANFFRTGCWSTLMFLTLEQSQLLVKKHFHKSDK